MAIFRNSDTISLALLDFLRIVQPDLDTKPGSVARELFVDAPASELAKLYIELRNIANLQSFSSARGRRGLAVCGRIRRRAFCKNGAQRH